MLGRIVEVASNHRHLLIYRGFLLIKDTQGDRKELGRIPLDDISALIGNAHGLSYTNHVLVQLAERGIPFVLCGNNHNAIGVLWSLNGNCELSKRIDAQLQASLPLKKRLWADIIKIKIANQASVLTNIGLSHIPVQALVNKVRSGDPENIEAQAARKYWMLLFGNNFRRNKAEIGINSLLNYGYTVLRATVARAVVAAGLHPSIGLHHSNMLNPMRLVDDLIEPFRPYVDYLVYRLVQNGCRDLLPEVKRHLALLMYEDLVTSQGMTPLTVCTQRLVLSLAQVFMGDRKKLDFPYVGSLSINLGGLC